MKLNAPYDKIKATYSRFINILKRGIKLMNYTRITEFNGTPVAELSAGGYTAVIAYEIGSNVIRLHDDKNGVEFFRFKKDNPAEAIKQSAEVWGLPTLYLPNRFADGVLKTTYTVFCKNARTRLSVTAQTITALARKQATYMMKTMNFLNIFR